MDGTLIRWTFLYGVGDGSGGVLAAGWGGPRVVAGRVLGKLPACGLFLVMVVAAAGARVAGAGFPAGFPGDGVLEIAALRGPAAGWPGALAVAYFDEVAELVAGVVGAGFVPVVAVIDGDRFQVH